ncbi:MAG: hypothetical protein J6V72_19775 [Kiritimatiellae bacterium]|nr:hypothetical protein [Kiritimatiellia bacterium]
MASNSTRYAINMEDGRVVPMTAQTLNNYVYQEIEPEVAFMIDRGEVDPKDVIDQITAQLPKETLRDKLKKVARQNVRQADFGLREAARASVDMGESKVVKVKVPRKRAEAADAPAEKKAEAIPKPKVNI